MSKLIDRITGVDTGKYRVEETKDDQRRRQNQENQYTPNKEKDQFDKKGGSAAWKKILPDSRQSLRAGNFRNKEEISFNRIEVSEVSRVIRKPHWSHPYLTALGIMTRRGKVRPSVAVAYGVMIGIIGTISIFILRIILF